MINVNLSLSISAALNILRNATLPVDAMDQLQKSIESAFAQVASAEYDTMSLTLYNICNIRDNRIKCIAAVRRCMGWGLKESKEFVDVVVGEADYSHGYYDDFHNWIPSVRYNGGLPNTLVGPVQAIRDLEKTFIDMRCEVAVDKRLGC